MLSRQLFQKGLRANPLTCLRIAQKVAQPKMFSTYQKAAVIQQWAQPLGAITLIKPSSSEVEENQDWQDILLEDVDDDDDVSAAMPIYQCVKTQARRILKMKKHRRAKRKKHLLLKLKKQEKI